MPAHPMYFSPHKKQQKNHPRLLFAAGYVPPVGERKSLPTKGLLTGFFTTRRTTGDHSGRGDLPVSKSKKRIYDRAKGSRLRYQMARRGLAAAPPGYPTGKHSTNEKSALGLCLCGKCYPKLTKVPALK